MTMHAAHRLDGLEPDNLLAFMALPGLLRTLEETRPGWRPRVSWTVDEAPLRPCLHVAEEVAGNAIVEAAAEGLAALAPRHDFEGLPDLTLLPCEAARRLRKAAGSDRYTADLWAALVSNAAITPRCRSGGVRLALLGGGRETDGAPTMSWPIWREPIGLAGIRALLGHPYLDRPETRAALGVVERRRTRRISSGQYMNVTRAEARFE